MSSTGSQRYQFPEGMAAARASDAFAAFRRNYADNSRGLSRREIDLSFLRALTPEERRLAQAFLRLNLHTRHVHVVKGVADLGDRSCIPTLEAMIADERDSSRRLTIAGSLWRLNRDEVFVGLLDDMIRSSRCDLITAHQDEISWLADARAIEFMIRTLTVVCSDSSVDPRSPLGRGAARGLLESVVRDRALQTLCEIEDRGRLTAAQTPPRTTNAYLARRGDLRFVESMVQNLREWYLPMVFPEVALP